MPLLLVLLLGLLPTRHAYHASIAEMRYNAPAKQLELSIKVFTDDFEKALSKGQSAPVSLAAPGQLPAALAAAYLKRTLTFSTPGGAPLPITFLGLQAEKDAYWLYCKVPLPGPMPGIKVRNTILLDAYPDQANVLNVEAGAVKRSALFRNGHEQEEIKW